MPSLFQQGERLALTRLKLKHFKLHDNENQSE